MARLFFRFSDKNFLALLVKTCIFPFTGRNFGKILEIWYIYMSYGTKQEALMTRKKRSEHHTTSSAKAVNAEFLESLAPPQMSEPVSSLSRSMSSDSSDYAPLPDAAPPKNKDMLLDTFIMSEPQYSPPRYSHTKRRG